jgi:peptide deformylase
MSEILTYNTESNLDSITITSKPYPIFTEKHPALNKAVPLSSMADNPVVFSNIIRRLKLTLQTYSALGISANQCGVNERIMILGTDHFNLVCINPKIIWYSPETGIDYESCLSFPGLTLKIERHKEIGVEYFDETGKICSRTFQGVTARIFQHQLDILDGVLYTSKVGSVALRLAKDRQKLLVKKTQRKLNR